jgi:uncharacterized protein (TIRG00374 family)
MSVDIAKQRRKRILSWAINLSGILAFALILYLGGVEAWQQMLTADWRYVLAALAVTLVWNLIAAYRWALIAGQVSDEAAACPFRYFFTYHMIGMLTGQVLPITVGMLGGRPVALSLSRGVPLKQAAISVFLDKLFDLILALLLVVPVALYLVHSIGLALALGLMAGLVAIGAVLIALKYEPAVRWLGRVASRLARPLAHVPVIGRRLAGRLPQQLDRLAAESFLPNRSAVQVLALTLVMYALLSARLYYISQALHLAIPWYVLAMSVCVTQLTLIFSVTPGSLGFLEGGWGAVFSLAGLSLEQFTFFVIGRRALFLIFTLFTTLLAFAWIRESPARLFRTVFTASKKPAGESAILPAETPASPAESLMARSVEPGPKAHTAP